MGPKISRFDLGARNEIVVYLHSTPGEWDPRVDREKDIDLQKVDVSKIIQAYASRASTRAKSRDIRRCNQNARRIIAEN